MIAVIDVGNTRVKWGLHPGTGAAAGGFAATGECPAQEVLPALEGALASGALRSIAWCSVAGAEAMAELAAKAGRQGIPVRRAVASAAGGGVVNGYRDPGSLGADRFAALVGARARTRGAVLVVDAGTAMTVDSLAPDGRFLGGMIVPGYRLMLAALARGTMELPLAAGTYAGLPRSTDEAIVSGALHALAGAVERGLRELREACGEASPTLLLAGGDAHRLVPLLERAAPQCAPHLVLEGLAVIAMEGAGP